MFSRHNFERDARGSRGTRGVASDRNRAGKIVSNVKRERSGKGWVHRDPPIVKIKVLSTRRKLELNRLLSEVRRPAASGRGGLAGRVPARKPPRRAKRGAPWAAAAEG